jgi:glucose/arabinose dehydrogenase
VPTARGLALSPDGVIYATSYGNGGRVYALPDHNHDGIADSIITVATGLGSPHGLGFYNNDLYVSNPTNFYRMIDANHDRVSESRVSLLTFAGGGHTTRNFVFDTIKKKVYIQIGSSSNMGPDTNDSTRATVTEANPDGTDRRIFARGLRNSVGMDIDPRTGVLWVNNNGMDNLFGSGNPKSNDNPSECVYMLCDGANYGWPWAYGFQMRNPTNGFNNIDTAIIQTFSGPVAEVLAHEAPLGLHFYRGSALPAIYHNAIFQTYHGSWNRTPPAPPRVTVMWADSNGKNAQVTDIINGFQPDSTGFRYGRVVSIIEGADSALYISDDAANCVYKFWWAGLATVPNQKDKSDFQEITIAPNPANASAIIHYNLANTENVSIELLDIRGAKVWYIDLKGQPQGEHSYELEAQNLPAGSYTILVKDSHTVRTGKLSITH